jgi:uncharacterized protein (DUF952 family)
MPKSGTRRITRQRGTDTCEAPIRSSVMGKEFKMIYHIVKEKDYLHLMKADSYIPANFDENGFVHCALEVSVISVANDYYLNVEGKILLLKIDPSKLKSQTKYESAATEKGAGTQHLSTSSVFPHVYGAIDNSAVEGIGALRKEKNGFVWPEKFISLAEYLNRFCV